MAKGKEKRKVKRVLKEFSENKLHAGSKKGPLVRGRDQAVAIAMKESGQSRDKKK